LFFAEAFVALGYSYFGMHAVCEKRRGFIEIELRRKDDDTRKSILL
jgi:hypothetical protein